MKLTKDILLDLQDKIKNIEGYNKNHRKEYVDTYSNHYEFLNELVKIIKPNLCVELGTHLGVASWYMFTGYPSMNLYTVDNNLIGSREIGKFVTELNKPDQIKFLLTTAKDAVKYIPDNIDLIFIDEEKDVEALQSNLDLYYPKVKEGGCLIFDDILGKTYYPEAYEWWVNLKGYNKIDLPLIHRGYAIGAIIK